MQCVSVGRLPPVVSGARCYTLPLSASVPRSVCTSYGARLPDASLSREVSPTSLICRAYARLRNEGQRAQAPSNVRGSGTLSRPPRAHVATGLASRQPPARKACRWPPARGCASGYVDAVASAVMLTSMQALVKQPAQSPCKSALSGGTYLRQPNPLLCKELYIYAGFYSLRGHAYLRNRFLI
jgi:hypothetical protein